MDDSESDRGLHSTALVFKIFVFYRIRMTIPNSLFLCRKVGGCKVVPNIYYNISFNIHIAEFSAFWSCIWCGAFGKVSPSDYFQRFPSVSFRRSMDTRNACCVLCFGSTRWSTKWLQRQTRHAGSRFLELLWRRLREVRVLLASLPLAALRSQD